MVGYGINYAIALINGAASLIFDLLVKKWQDWLRWDQLIQCDKNEKIFFLDTIDDTEIRAAHL